MNVFLKNKDYRRFSVASFLSSAGDILFYLAFMTYASKLQNYSLYYIYCVLELFLLCVRFFNYL